jgi:hypothetical protein
MLDVPPRNEAIVEFGLTSQERYEAHNDPVRKGEITPEQLDAALGKGEKLTKLARAAPSDRHKEIAQERRRAVAAPALGSGELTGCSPDRLVPRAARQQDPSASPSRHARPVPWIGPIRYAG